jgi:hypothetical protein
LVRRYGTQGLEEYDSIFAYGADKDPTRCLRVHIAPQDHAYGLARMFQIMSGELRPKIFVVRTNEEVQRVLGIGESNWQNVSGF